MKVKSLRVCGDSCVSVNSFNDLVVFFNTLECCISNKKVNLIVLSLSLQHFPLSQTSMVRDRMIQKPQPFSVAGQLEFRINKLPKAPVALNDFFESINIELKNDNLININTGTRGRYVRNICLKGEKWPGLQNECEQHILLQKIRGDHAPFYRFEYQSYGT